MLHGNGSYVALASAEADSRRMMKNIINTVLISFILHHCITGLAVAVNEVRKLSIYKYIIPD